MWSEFGVKKNRTRVPYKRSLGRRHTFCIKLETSKIQPNQFFHIFQTGLSFYTHGQSSLDHLRIGPWPGNEINTRGQTKRNPALTEALRAQGEFHFSNTAAFPECTPYASLNVAVNKLRISAKSCNEIKSRALSDY
jgi:hypothetical protein